jgi:DNA-binding transcriptional ArsR family regulator
MFYVIIRCVMSRREKPFDRELFFRALADSTRLRIINLIGDQEVCVFSWRYSKRTSQRLAGTWLIYVERVSSRRDVKESGCIIELQRRSMRTRQKCSWT